MIILLPNEVLALSRANVENDYSPMTEQCYLLIEYQRCLTIEETSELSIWVRQLTCPVIMVVDADETDLLISACDVCVTNFKEAELLVEKIDDHPIAATVFVQTLRATAQMPLEDAVTVESLAYTTLQTGPEYANWLVEHQVDSPFQSTDEGEAVIIERDENRVALTLNRASNHNAMNVEMRDALIEALQRVLMDNSIISLQINGRGKCFSTGGDLTEFGSVPNLAIGHIVRSLAVPGRLLSRVTARIGKRCSVHLHGACVGSGMEFPAFAGRITAEPDTYFLLPEVGMGLIPGAGGCISIARRIGRQRAAWLGLSGERMSAEQALSCGLVDEIVA